MIDDCDEPVRVWHERHHIARVAHKCNECRRFIRAGERYMVERLIVDETARTHKTCAHCQVAREWLVGQCGGWIYGEIGEDIEAHARDSFGFGYGFHVVRMAAGIKCGWIRKDGKRLWPVPSAIQR